MMDGWGGAEINGVVGLLVTVPPVLLTMTPVVFAGTEIAATTGCGLAGASRVVLWPVVPAD